jgi:hypothetical protein
MGVRWEYMEVHGSTVRVHGSTMGVRWEYGGVQWEYDGSTMGVQWEYMGVQWEYDGSTMGIRWEYKGSTRGVKMKYNEARQTRDVTIPKPPIPYDIGRYRHWSLLDFTKN